MNWEDIPEKQREVLVAQQGALLSMGSWSIASSAFSTLTGSLNPSVICHSKVTLHQDIVILSTQSSKPQILIVINSQQPHASSEPANGHFQGREGLPGLALYV